MASRRAAPLDSSRSVTWLSSSTVLGGPSVTEHRQFQTGATFDVLIRLKHDKSVPHEAIGYRADRSGGSPGRVRRGSGAYRLTRSDHGHRELGSNVDPGAVTTRRPRDGVRPRRPENAAVRWGRNE